MNASSTASRYHSFHVCPFLTVVMSRASSIPAGSSIWGRVGGSRDHALPEGPLCPPKPQAARSPSLMGTGVSLGREALGWVTEGAEPGASVQPRQQWRGRAPGAGAAGAPLRTGWGRGSGSLACTREGRGLSPKRARGQRSLSLLDWPFPSAPWSKCHFSGLCLHHLFGDIC